MQIQHQGQIELIPVTEVEVDGIQMGVLSDGTPYLTARGLAKMCGVDHSVILRFANNWGEERFKPRGQKIQQLLAAQGVTAPESLFIMTRGFGGESHAYTDAVCMAMLEYYAFEVDTGAAEVALRNFRTLARFSFRQFIYNRCGYDPQKQIPDSWKNFHERILLNDQVPIGFYSVFREIADLVVHMIQQGFALDSHSVPDGSVGLAWSKHWEAKGLEEQYGERIKHPHNFPEWFPQSAVNPVPVWIYPVASLGVFREWLYVTYIPEKFPKYLDTKVKKGALPPSKAELLIAAVARPALPAN